MKSLLLSFLILLCGIWMGMLIEDLTINSDSFTIDADKTRYKCREVL